ncbi:MAG: M28 family peptidase [Planctomycetota bacterium]|nr:M28 family peptidase [Planctomycetota bacterium]MDA1211578.1 M28 family peptidase [Planctomycetota bacterium]
MHTPQNSRESLRHLVVELSRSPRPADSPALERARAFVTATLEDSGWEVTPYSFAAEDDIGTPLNGINLIAVHRSHQLEKMPRICLGAHLDSVANSPGADDNASAVASLLEIARLLPGCWPDDSPFDVEFIVFDLEERGMLGGAAHAQLMATHNIPLVGMISLEMLGYCDHHPGSQNILPGLEGLYPTTGNFIGVVGNERSREFRQAFCDGLREIENLPVEWLDVPGNGESFPPSRLSDHSPFWDRGYPALMVTDTSFLRNPHYHTPNDTAETLDFEFLEKVTLGCLKAIVQILKTDS